VVLWFLSAFYHSGVPLPWPCFPPPALGKLCRSSSYKEKLEASEFILDSLLKSFKLGANFQITSQCIYLDYEKYLLSQSQIAFLSLSATSRILSLVLVSDKLEDAKDTV
jgi:hypothetical protein